MTSEIIRLEPTKLKRRFQIINDGLPGFLLLYTGLETLIENGFNHGFMPYLSIVVGIVVVRSAVEELRGGAIHRKINWFDVSGGCVIILEAASRYNPSKGFQPAHLLILAGVVTILRGIFDEKFPRVRRVVLSDEGLFVRTKPFVSVKCRWSDLARIDRSPSTLTFVSDREVLTLNLKGFGNKSEVMEKIIDVAANRGIAIRELA